MTERKCEWLDGDEFSDMLASYRIFSSADSAEEFDLIRNFIRARVEEEIRNAVSSATVLKNYQMCDRHKGQPWFTINFGSGAAQQPLIVCPICEQSAPEEVKNETRP